MTDDATPHESSEEHHFLTRDEILATRLREFDAPAAGVRMIVLSERNEVALMQDADNEDLDDRAFVVAVVARQIIEPATTPEEVGVWDNDRLLAALATFVEQDDVSVVPEGELLTFASFRASTQAKSAARRASMKAALGPLAESQLLGVSEAIRNMVSTRIDLGGVLGSATYMQGLANAMKGQVGLGANFPGKDIVDAAKAVPPPMSGAIVEAARQAAERASGGLIAKPSFETLVTAPNYEAKTASGVERLAEFQEASIRVAREQQDELVTLNESVGLLGARQEETNKELRGLRGSTAPRWVAYATLGVAVLALLVGLWISQPHGSTTPAPSATPVASSLVSPSP